MARAVLPPGIAPARRVRRSRRAARIAVAASAFALAALVGVVGQRDPRAPGPQDAPAAPRPAPARSEAWSAWLDPRPASTTDASGFSRARPAAALFARAPGAEPAPEIAREIAGPPPRPAERAAPAPSPMRLAAAPLPVPRPADLAPRTAEEAPRPERRSLRRARATVPPPPAEEPGFLEKFFGLEPAPKPALAYAALETPALPRGPLGRLDPAPAVRGGTAVYDITARTVTLPSGERLEAHSGLGDKMDDPRYVHVRMRGATPPGTYELTERERLFHGVRAIRLNPVGGSAAIHGRDGILAHTYMLGPRGDSNGCVSFRDYDRFLRAFLRGEVSRLVVVAGNGLPRLAEGLFPRARAADRDG